MAFLSREDKKKRMANLPREDKYRMAYLSYSMKDYKTSFKYMSELAISVRGELSPSERELFLSSGDWSIDLLMTKIGKISAMLLLDDAAVTDYHDFLVHEVRMICRKYIDVLCSLTIVTSDLLSLVKYYWAKGDCYRTIVETMKYKSTDEFKTVKRDTIKAYRKAWDEARILVNSDPGERKHLAVLGHRFVLFLCDIAEQYTEAREIASKTISDIKAKNTFSWVMNMGSHMECAYSIDQLKMLIGLCDSKLKHVPVPVPVSGVNGTVPVNAVNGANRNLKWSAPTISSKRLSDYVIIS